ncbi:MAG: sulfotransferase domain-containing protein [bacterium]
MNEKLKLNIMKLLELIHFHKSSSKKDIFIFTTFRSGSTWLAEIIESQPRIKFSGAPPLSPDKVEYFNNICNYTDIIKPRWQYCNLDIKESELIKEYISKIKNGKILNSRRYGNLFSKNHNFITDRTVIRYLRSCALIDWFCDNFDDYTIFLSRHPIPTSLSRLKIWNRNDKIKYWGYYIEDFLKSDYYTSTFLTNDLLKYVNYKYKVSNDLEKFVLSWCLEFLPIMKKMNKLKKNNNFIILTYEEMVLNTDKVIQLLSNKLQLDNRDRMFRQAKIPSTTVRHSDENTRIKFENGDYGQRYLIEKWKKEIDINQEKKIFEIIDKFNIDMYNYGNVLPKDNYFNFT